MNKFGEGNYGVHNSEIGNGGCNTSYFAYHDKNGIPKILPKRGSRFFLRSSQQGTCFRGDSIGKYGSIAGWGHDCRNRLL